ncbi:MAG: hypothetical protein GX577_06770 [Leptolinea sp.]|nr:hypothetical protein [Leptolinea sp.]
MKQRLPVFLISLMLLASAFTWVTAEEWHDGLDAGLSDQSSIRTGNLRKVDTTITPVPSSTSGCEIPLHREDFASLDVANEWKRIDELDAMNVDYWESTGQSNPLEKIRDSSLYDVALHFAGYPNSDGTTPDRVTLVFTDTGHTVVTVLSEGLLDDSIMDQEYRIELGVSEDIWIINWAGVRYRCARSGNFDWTTTLCP